MEQYREQVKQLGTLEDERNTRMKTVEKSLKDTKVNCIDNFFGCIINALKRK